MNRTFHKRLLEARLKKGLSKTDLAKKIGTSYMQIAKYETGKTRPSFEMLCAIVEELDESYDYLISGSDRTRRNFKIIRGYIHDHLESLSEDELDSLRRKIETFFEDRKVMVSAK